MTVVGSSERTKVEENKKNHERIEQNEGERKKKKEKNLVREKMKKKKELERSFIP